MEQILNSIDLKMKVIISLLVDLLNQKDDIQERDIIKKLHDLKINNIEIADILNKTPKQIADQVYKSKRTTTTKNKKGLK
jgi:hypothetical protein